MCENINGLNEEGRVGLGRRGMVVRRGPSGEQMSTNSLSIDLDNLPENRDVVIAGGYTGVRVFITDQTYNGKMKVRKWSDTGMLGVLKIVRVNGVEGVPIAVVRLYSTDEVCETLSSILEYELPTNFIFDPALTETFSALLIMQDQFLGFLFTNMEDREAFDKKL